MNKPSVQTFPSLLVSLTPVVHLELQLSVRIFEKIRKGANRNHQVNNEKNLKSGTSVTLSLKGTVAPDLIGLKVIWLDRPCS